MLEGRSPEIFGGGEQTRDFVYVEHVARANLLATLVSGSDLGDLSTGIETSVNEVYRHLAQHAGYRGTPAYAPARAGEVHRIALDPARAREWLGWTPATPLVEGLRRTVEWFRRRGNQGAR